MNRKFFSLVLITALFAVTVTDAFSQVEGKIRGGLNYGVNFAMDVSVLGDVNFGYNPRDNMNIGAKLGFAMIEDYSYFSMAINALGTYTYYFGSRSIMPFVGGGLGIYSFINNKYYGMATVNYDKFGALFTTGIEFGRFRFAAEYNLVPASNVRLRQSDGTDANINFKNSYAGVTVGFYLGGGSRKKIEREKIAAADAAENERIAGIFSIFAMEYTEPRMSEWQQQGEFETNASYQQRVNEMTRIAKYTEFYREAEQEFIALRSGNFVLGEMTLGAYNHDNETFPVTNSIHGAWTMNVPRDEASRFRENWSSFVRLPQFGIRNDRLALVGINFVSTDGNIFRFRCQDDDGVFTL